jgi:hypothetical protein
MKRLLRIFGLDTAPPVRERFDPVYGLPWSSLESWLAKNPSHADEYAAALDRRSRRCRIDYGKLRKAHRRRTPPNERAGRNGTRTGSRANVSPRNTRSPHAPLPARETSTPREPFPGEAG